MIEKVEREVTIKDYCESCNHLNIENECSKMYEPLCLFKIGVSQEFGEECPFYKRVG